MLPAVPLPIVTVVPGGPGKKTQKDARSPTRFTSLYGDGGGSALAPAAGDDMRDACEQPPNPAQGSPLGTK